ncbi:MAG: Uma2 family endonuclease [Alkalinema sp. RL_2_19]|nr:Uma2 family endonuclease [Alkalinema sp. RL_2_19]
MLKYLEPIDGFPTAEDLPDCDSTPVDSELQEFIPTFLKTLLISIWADRQDWFFGVDMGLYYSPDEPAVVPDGFLAIGVDRIKSETSASATSSGRNKSYPNSRSKLSPKNIAVNTAPKKDFYQQLGILYYVIYNPRRKRKPSLEIYKLIQGQYVQMLGSSVWMPELNIGIGKERFNYQGYDREWLFWYDEQRQRYLTAEEKVIQAAAEAQAAAAQAQAAAAQVQAAEAQVQAAEARAQQLADRLRALGIDPDVPDTDADAAAD